MKNSQKGFAIPIIIAIVALLAAGGGAYIYTNNKVEVPVNIPDITNNVPTTTPPGIVDGDRDAYGCIGSAGYTWCAVKNKCLRIWEERCENTPINSRPGDKDGSVVCTMDAKQCPDGSYVGRSGPNCEFICPAIAPSVNSDEPPLLLKSIGFNLDYYDPASNRAGDFVFTKEKLQFDRLFMGYGFFIPSSSASPDKYNVQPTFILPLGTPARSLVDGIVAGIPVLWSGDYSVQVTANGKMEKWIYETEHIINPKVKVGDRVTAGQIVGEVSDFSKGVPVGFGIVEIGILKGGQVPQHVCPYAYLDPSIKQETQKKIIALYKAWEDYLGDPTLYNESESTPGCLTLDPIDG